MVSKEYSLIKEDLLKIGKGAIIAGTGALCTSILQNIGSIDFGQWTPLVVAGISILTNTLLKFVEKTKY
jgi:hypothetical protein